ncbi:hypothetical protein CLAIMM_02438 isoform 2 [Cladophialophora immunda]|nr:hypothetical protein CLAIMM_02438 isoform 2 [Cladophialophora immunda]
MATPIVVGVADVVNRSLAPRDAREPLQLMVEAVQKAMSDTGLSPPSAQKLQSSITSVYTVRCWTWPYADLPELLAQRLGVTPLHKRASTQGGHNPAMLFDEAARAISRGESKVAVLAGGEALASLQAWTKVNKGSPPPWTPVEQEVGAVFSPTTRDLEEGLGSIHSIGRPIQIYPLYENGFRAHRGQSLPDNNRESAQLYASFARVAAQNPRAWTYGRPAESADTIGKVTRKNRMICMPYPLLMNAYNTVNCAAACLLTSTDYAQELGIPSSKWIFPLGGASTRDSLDFWERPNFHSSPSISHTLDAVLRVSGLTKDEIDLYDIYSCFPIVPKLACHHLGLSILEPAKPITLLGGLTFFGGAGNNYSMHALTEMVRQLRHLHGPSRKGLILANGGFMTYQYALCLSNEPGSRQYPKQNPLPEVWPEGTAVPLDPEPQGEATIETYTVEFGRDGAPVVGHIVGRTKSGGRRFLANHADVATLQQLASASEEQIGKSGTVRQHPGVRGKNLFSFTKENKLCVSLNHGLLETTFSQQFPVIGSASLPKRLKTQDMEPAQAARQQFPPGGFAGMTNRVGVKPILAACNGYVFGGGFEIILNADIVIASESASFGLLEGKRGLAALAGALPRVIRNFGLQRAMDLGLTARILPVREAQQWGLVKDVVPAEQLVERAVAVAREITALSPDSVVVTRAGIREGWEVGSLNRATAATAERYRYRLFSGENMREGLAAFQEKREPVWKPSRL